jgi:hypothetical protein
VEAEVVDRTKVDHQEDQAVAEARALDHQVAEAKEVLETLVEAEDQVGHMLVAEAVKTVLAEADQKQVEQHYHHQSEELQRIFLVEAEEQVQVQLDLKQLLFLEWVELVEQHQVKQVWLSLNIDIRRINYGLFL